MSALAQQIILGILIGGLYGLAAAGLSLVFGVLKVLNVAHGELIMLGGYAAFWSVALLGVDPFGSLVLVAPLSLLAGVVLYGALFGFVVRANEETRELGAHLCGRRLYEEMVYWETAHEKPGISETELEFAGLEDLERLYRVIAAGQS